MPPTIPVTLTYNTTTSQLTFDNAVIPVVEVNTTIEVTISNAILAQQPTTMILPGILDQAHPQLSFTPSDDRKKVTITVNTLPTHFLRPWVLALNVNLNTDSSAVVMDSPSLFVVTNVAIVPGQPTAFTSNVLYDRSSGIFNIDSAFELASLSIVVLPIAPLSLTFNLGDSAIFDQQPLSFDGGAPPWIEDPEIPAPNQVTLSIPAPPQDIISVPGFASFRFRINVTSGDKTILVTSPDPILVNATIGDGTGT